MNRWLFKLVLFLILGMIATTVIAWAFEVIRPMDTTIISWSRVTLPTNEPQWFIMKDSRKVGAMMMDFKAELLYQPLGRPRKAPYWSRAVFAPSIEDAKAGLHIVEHANGWPMLSHRRSSTTRQRGQRSYTGLLITVPWRSRNAFVHNRTLPLHPIWPGFAINTIFYTAILWLLTLAPFTARRMIRRKRGLCFKCGYDMRGNSGGCPECGWGREAEA